MRSDGTLAQPARAADHSVKADGALKGSGQVRAVARQQSGGRPRLSLGGIRCHYVARFPHGSVRLLRS